MIWWRRRKRKEEHIPIEVVKEQIFVDPDNIVGISGKLKPRIRKGKIVPEEKVVRVYVKKKIPFEEIDVKKLIPEEVKVGVFKKYKTDVVEVGEIEFHGTKKRRPAKDGDSIGHYEISAGTLGGTVYVNGKRMILTNNHVGANLSFAEYQRAKIGDPVLQPGRYDGGDFELEDAQDVIGVLYMYIPLKLKGKNKVDAAIINPLLEEMVEDSGFSGYLTNAEIHDGLKGYFVGRSSGVKEIEVVDDAFHTLVNYKGQLIEFEDQILFTPPSIPGDSGSIIRTHDGRVFGLVFAGSRTHGVANKIENVINEFRVMGVNIDFERPIIHKPKVNTDHVILHSTTNPHDTVVVYDKDHDTQNVVIRKQTLYTAEFNFEIDKPEEVTAHISIFDGNGVIQGYYNDTRIVLDGENTMYVPVYSKKAFGNGQIRMAILSREGDVLFFRAKKLMVI